MKRFASLASAVLILTAPILGAAAATNHSTRNRRERHAKIAGLQEQMVKLKAIEQRLLASPDQQVSLTDPVARSMKSRDGGIVGYNVQCAVEAQNHLIVAHEVVTDGIDRDLLTTMAEQAQEAMDQEDLTAVVDRGYYKAEEILSANRRGSPRSFRSR